MNQSENRYGNVLAKVLGRQKSFITKDIAHHWDELKRRVSSSRILVIGGAGSIGGAFVKELVNYQPQALHLVDVSENSLVEIVRDLRSSDRALPRDFQTFAVDFSQPEFGAILNHETYDYVLNFSALKHVRSERDPYTLMRLLQVNVLANENLSRYLKGSPTKRIFSVSSDKSVRPGNVMGASKAFMERVLISHAEDTSFTSARFANVAFSDGSLLCSFEHRLRKRQPISAPNDVKRYFISHEEAGQLCLLGCFLGNNREIFVPQFEPENDMMTFSEIAKAFVIANDMEPVECSSEKEALEMAAQLPDKPKRWPCYFSASNTSGEKAFEEFVDPKEACDRDRYENVEVVTKPVFHGREPLEKAMDIIQQLRTRGTWSKSALVDAVKLAVPELNHIETDKNLDEKM